MISPLIICPLVICPLIICALVISPLIICPLVICPLIYAMSVLHDQSPDDLSSCSRSMQDRAFWIICEIK